MNPPPTSMTLACNALVIVRNPPLQSASHCRTPNPRTDAALPGFRLDSFPNVLFCSGEYLPYWFAGGCAGDDHPPPPQPSSTGDHRSSPSPFPIPRPRQKDTQSYDRHTPRRRRSSLDTENHAFVGEGRRAPRDSFMLASARFARGDQDDEDFLQRHPITESQSRVRVF